jgi:hypothetical protein
MAPPESPDEFARRIKATPSQLTPDEIASYWAIFDTLHSSEPGSSMEPRRIETIVSPSLCEVDQVLTGEDAEMFIRLNTYSSNKYADATRLGSVAWQLSHAEAAPHVDSTHIHIWLRHWLGP